MENDIGKALDEAKNAALEEFRRQKKAQEGDPADLNVDKKIRIKGSPKKQEQAPKKIIGFAGTKRRSLFDAMQENKQIKQTEKDEPIVVQDEMYSVDEDLENETKKVEQVENKDVSNDTGKAESNNTDNKTENEEAKKQELQELQENVETTRKAWVEMEWKKKNAFKSAYDKLGLVFKRHNTKERIEREDDDIEYYRSWYEDSLSKYKDALLKNAEEKNFSDEDLSNILLKFEKERQISIADTRTEVKIENEAGKFSTLIKDNSKQILDSYRKMSWKKKWLIAGAFIGAGVLTAGGTGVAAGVAGAAIATRRAFIAAVTGTGVWAGLDSRTRNKREGMIEKNKQSIMEKMEGLTNEEKKEMISNHLESIIGGVDGELKKVKNENVRNIGIGIVSGIGLSYGISHVYGHFFGGASEVTGDVESPVAEDANVTEGTADDVKGGTADEIIGGNTENLTGAVLEVEKGSSLEGTLIKHFKDLGMNNAEAGKQAHLAALAYAEEHGIEKGPYSLIHEGTKLVMSEDGKNLLGIEGDDKLGWLNSDGSHELEKDISRAGVNEEVINNEPEEVAEPKADIENKNSEMLDNMEKDLNEALNPSDSPETTSEEITENTTIEGSPEEILNDNCKRTMQELSLNDNSNWRAMKGMTLEDLRGPNGMSTKINEVVEKTMKNAVKTLGSTANFQEGEKIGEWVVRVNKEMLKNIL